MQLSRRITSLTSRFVTHSARFSAHASQHAATETSSGTDETTQPSMRDDPSGNDEIDVTDEALTSNGQPHRYSRWINQTTQGVIGGSSNCETTERFRRANQSLPRLEGQVQLSSSRENLLLREHARS